MSGYTTIHAGSARQALSRLRFICQLADGGLSVAALNGLVSETVDLVVHCDRRRGIPEVTEVVAVEDGQGPRDSAVFTTTTLFGRDQHDHGLRWSGNLPVRAQRSFERSGVDVRDLLDVHGAALESATWDLRVGGSP